MSTVSDETRCRSCGRMAFVEFSTRTYDEFTFCGFCGRHEEYNYQTRAHNVGGGHGSYRLVWRRGGASTGAFKSRRHANWFARNLAKTIHRRGSKRRIALASVVREIKPGRWERITKTRFGNATARVGPKQLFIKEQARAERYEWESRGVHMPTRIAARGDRDKVSAMRSRIAMISRNWRGAQSVELDLESDLPF